MELDILRAICRKGGAVLYNDLADMGVVPLNCLDDLLMRNPDMFSIVCVDKEKVVLVRGDIRLCEIKDCEDCQGLHMCRHYLLGDCSDDGCPFSHELNTPHNIAVLMMHGLLGPNEYEISNLLFQNELLPDPQQQTSKGNSEDGLPPAPAPSDGPGSTGTSSESTDKPSDEDATVDEICDLHLIGCCNKADAVCDKVHSSMPYLWQQWSDNQWRPLSNNEEIERDYCNPAKTKHVGIPPVDFGTMTCGLDKVRRLSIRTSTINSVSSLITKWVWYWEEAEPIWKEYCPAGDKQFPSITSDELERRYLNGETTVTFAAENHQYELSFSDLLQTNVSTKKQRLVRRRPVFISKADVWKVCDIYRKIAMPIIPESVPDYWNLCMLPAVGYERIKLDTTSPEYSKVINHFQRTMAGCNILSIERIQNLTSWKFFNLQKDAMKCKAGKDVTERLLFHGTKSKYVDAICRENIDWRMCGMNGTRYGKGSYFAKCAKFSDRYTDEHTMKFMFLCRILVGDFCLGNPNDNKPPFKDKEMTIAFDSCVDSLEKPTIFVIFEKNQIYPEYLINYEAPTDEMKRVTPAKVAPVQAAPVQVQPQAIPTLAQPQPSADEDKGCTCSDCMLILFCGPCYLLYRCFYYLFCCYCCC